jgi:hypothetical protein
MTATYRIRCTEEGWAVEPALQATAGTPETVISDAPYNGCFSSLQMYRAIA